MSSAAGQALWLVQLVPSNIVIPAVPSINMLAEWKELLARSAGEAGLSREEIEVVEELARQLKVDKRAAQAILAKAIDAERWRYKYAELEENIDKHIESAEALALRLPQMVSAPRRWSLVAVAAA